ncbi:MAG TPA: adenylate/guanylate cyclase domain-containing protein, partial [Candidatus Baltobacteraceae bacterium]|nr:adenylate/guanylate cyclase domain-containing protein [Candidatus Baltobacteraceae bacterium]
MQVSIPTGTVTFLFTDIEGSTRLWERMPDDMSTALAAHDALLRSAIEENGGYVFKTVGDAFCAAFAEPHRAVQAAIAAQRSLREMQRDAASPLRVRMGIHSGTAEVRGNDYFGPALNRVSRLLSIVRGGQVFISQSTQLLVQDVLPAGASLTALGEFHLKDLERTENAYQVCFDGMEEIRGAVAQAVQPPSNLPSEISAFIGRHAELETIHGMLRAHRMVTLVGPGGVGKTRLALRAAEDQRAQRPGGTWLVELVGARGEDELLPAICAALQIDAHSGAMTSIVHALNYGPAIVVLDNCEHVLDATRLFARRLLEHCPDLTILATSREPLHLAGEQIVEVAPLQVPAQTASIDELLRSDAVALVLDRVSAWGAYELNENNAGDIAQLCRRLDGIPLALELASARLRTLSPRQILKRLDRRFALLTGGDKTGPSHHWTLERAIDWSYEQLQPSEQRLYQRLTIFETPFTLDAAEAVCSGEPLRAGDIVDLLTQLADKSFIRCERTTGRWHILETMRAYARDRLDEAEVPALRARHLAFVIALAQRDHSDVAENAGWLDEMESMLADVRIAMEHGLKNDPQSALRLAVALRGFWNIRGYYQLGYDLLLGAVEVNAQRSDANEDRALVLTSASTLANKLGRYEAAVHTVDEARRLFASLHDQIGLAHATNTLGNIYSSRGKARGARALFRRAVGLFEAAGDLAQSAMPLGNLGILTMYSGANEEAEGYLREAYARAEKAGDARVLAWTQGALGELAQARGDFELAQRHYERWVDLSRLIGDK